MNYDGAVKRCITLLKKRQTAKWEIVKLALGVCIIKEGNNTSHRNYTLTAFAKDIGIPKGTLSRWKLEYENVVMKLTHKDKDLDAHALNQTMRRVKASNTTAEVRALYKRYSTGYKTKEDKTLRVYTDRLRSMHFFICYGSILKKLDKKDLAEMRVYLDEMIESIDGLKTKRAKTPLKLVNKARVLV